MTSRSGVAGLAQFHHDDVPVERRMHLGAVNTGRVPGGCLACHSVAFWREVAG